MLKDRQMAPTPSDSTAEDALALRDWLVGLQLPPRAINPLRKDLEVVLGQREAGPGASGVLAGVDRAQFVAELYRDEGGLIRSIPSVGALVIEALREAIPPTRPAPAPKPAAPPPDEGWRAFELDDLGSPPPAEQAAAPADDAPPPAPARRRGRPRREPRPNPVADPPPQPAAVATPPPTAPSAPPEPEEAQIRRFWRQLHPQGRRAVLSYIAEQLIEG
jgi:hypothetical protein